MGREENVKVFLDAMRLCKENVTIKTATDTAKNQQQVILETDSFNSSFNILYDTQTKIIVSQKRSYEAASFYKDMTVCVHNFASATNPGGGVENGASAQEECLCRCSNLYPCLKTNELHEKFYKPHRASHDPIHNDDIIYTPGIIVFKSDTANPQTLPESDWYNVNVITCAAPNLRSRPANIYNPDDGKNPVKIKDKELLILHEKRLRRILDVAYSQGNEVIILGAFGCGAFANRPEIVATAAKNVIKDYLNKFKVIEFAVYCSPKDDTNYKTFSRILK